MSLPCGVIQYDVSTRSPDLYLTGMTKHTHMHVHAHEHTNIHKIHIDIGSDTVNSH